MDGTFAQLTVDARLPKSVVPSLAENGWRAGKDERAGGDWGKRQLAQICGRTEVRFELSYFLGNDGEAVGVWNFSFSP